MLFICGGAFVGLEDIIARRLGRGATFGFDRSGSARQDEAANPLHHVLPEDVERFGLIPELLGRLPVIATLDDLGVEDLMRILQEPKNSLIAQYRKLLKYRNASLSFTDGALVEIARLAHGRGTGARGLRSIVEAGAGAGPVRPEAPRQLRRHRGGGAGRGGPGDRLPEPAQEAAGASGRPPSGGGRHRMSRRQSGKSPIIVLAWRYSLFVVTPIYLFVLWVFHPLLNTYGVLGKVWWLFVWWLCLQRRRVLRQRRPGMAADAGRHRPHVRVPA